MCFKRMCWKRLLIFKIISQLQSTCFEFRSFLIHNWFIYEALNFSGWKSNNLSLDALTDDPSATNEPESDDEDEEDDDDVS